MTDTKRAIKKSKKDWIGNVAYSLPTWETGSYQVAQIILTHGKEAWLSIPKDITENDIKIIEHQVQQLLLLINLNNQTNSK